MLIVSANEACNILAEWDAGSIAAFVDAMNAKAKALGCENTHFVNPSGLHDPDHYTSAWDLYLITKAAMQYPEFMEICDSAKAVIPATNLSKERTLYTTNLARPRLCVPRRAGHQDRLHQRCWALPHLLRPGRGTALCQRGHGCVAD